MLGHLEVNDNNKSIIFINYVNAIFLHHVIHYNIKFIMLIRIWYYVNANYIYVTHYYSKFIMIEQFAKLIF